MSYQYFLGRLKTIPPRLFSATPYQYRYDVAVMCYHWDSACTRNRLLAGLRPDPLPELTDSLYYSWIWRWDSGDRERTQREGRRTAKEGRKEKGVQRRKEGKGTRFHKNALEYTISRQKNSQFSGEGLNPYPI